MNILGKVYLVLKKVSDKLAIFIEFLSALLVFFCFFTVFLQVFNRYIMVKQTLIPWESISWTDELARFLLVGIGYAALSLCYRHGLLSRADMIYSKMRGGSKKALYIVETILIAIFLFYAIKYGLEFAQTSSHYKSDILRIPGNYLYLIPVIGEFLIGFEVLTEFIGVISGQVEPFDCIVPLANEYESTN